MDKKCPIVQSSDVCLEREKPCTGSAFKETPRVHSTSVNHKQNNNADNFVSVGDVGNDTQDKPCSESLHLGSQALTGEKSDIVIKEHAGNNATKECGKSFNANFQKPSNEKSNVNKNIADNNGKKVNTDSQIHSSENSNSAYKQQVYCEYKKKVHTDLQTLSVKTSFVNTSCAYKECLESVAIHSNLLSPGKFHTVKRRCSLTKGREPSNSGTPFGFLEKRYACNTCEKGFSKLSLLHIHRRSHTGEKPYLCSICERSFSTSSSLIRHQSVLHTDEKPYPCNACNTRYSSNSALRRHQQVHSMVPKEALYAREKKPRSDKALLPMMIQMKNHKGAKLHMCCECGRNFSVRSSLIRHQHEVHSGEKPYPCLNCDKRFSSKSSLFRHRRVHSKVAKGMYYCEKSNTSTFTLPSEQIDIKDQKDTKLHFCNNCGREFSVRSPHLRQACHMHSGDKPYQCSTCGNRFTSKCSLLRHQREVHSGEKPYQCSTCNKRFSSKSSLFRHSQAHSLVTRERQDACKEYEISVGALPPIHGANYTGSELHLCHKCSRTFNTSSSAVRQQLNMNHGEKPYPCITCGKQFSTKSSVFRHQQTHKSNDSQMKSESPYAWDKTDSSTSTCPPSQIPVTDATQEKLYVCMKCDRSFTVRSSLLRHQRLVHEGEKFYGCTICNKRLSSKSALRIHQQLHSPVQQEKPFECDQCAKRFRTRAQVKIHVRNHTGERPYLCNECGKSFTVSSTLVRHQIVHSGDNPYACANCKKAYRTRQSLVRHQQMHLSIPETGVPMGEAPAGSLQT